VLRRGPVGGARSGLWRDGDFLRLWAGQTVSEVGSQVTVVALPLAAILVLDASAFEVAILTSLEFAPFLLFGVVAGVWVDRLPYRRVLITTDIARAAVIGSVPVAYLLDGLTLPHLYAVGFAAGMLTVFFSLAWQAYLPTLVARERLIDANGKLAATWSAAQIVGPAAGGALVAAISAAGAVAADAISFVVSAWLLASMRHRERPRPRPATRNLRAELREGLAYLWRHPIFRANLFSSGLANLSYGIVWAVLIVFAVRELGLGAGLIGLILGIGALGGVIGAVTANRIAATIGVGPALIGAVFLGGPAAVLIALATPDTALVILTVGWALWSFESTVTMVLGVSIRQALVPQRLQGRIVGATRSVILGAIPAGGLIGGTLAATLGLRTTLIVGAAISAVSFVPLLLSPARHLRELAPLEPSSQRGVEQQPAATPS
jgi:MFS family permease